MSTHEDELKAALAEAAAHKAEAERLRTALACIAEIAHEGGLKEMSEGDALIAIRRATIPYWAALAATPTSKESETK